MTTIPPEDTAIDASGRLIDRREVLRRIPVSYPTIWHWMVAGTFPRSRNIGGKSAWVEAEVDAWIENRPLRKLKGDEPEVA
jgi:predicted DNA-binding transcriptional regulator AlpA